MKKSNLFWGLLLIAVAAILVIDALIPGIEIQLFRIALGVVCLSWVISSIFKRRVADAIFPLSFIFLLFEREIAWATNHADEDIISNWTVLLVALLLTFGIGILTSKKRVVVNITTNSAKEKTWKPQGQSSNTFNKGVKYIDCANIKAESLKNIFGEYTVYFQNLDCYEGGATIDISNKFGETNIYVPKSWNVSVDISSSCGSVNTHGTGDPTGKTLIITGSNTFGETNIHFG